LKKTKSDKYRERKRRGTKYIDSRLLCSRAEFIGGQALQFKYFNHKNETKILLLWDMNSVNSRLI